MTRTKWRNLSDFFRELEPDLNFTESKRAVKKDAEEDLDLHIAGLDEKAQKEAKVDQVVLDEKEEKKEAKEVEREAKRQEVLPERRESKRSARGVNARLAAYAL